MTKFILYEKAREANKSVKEFIASSDLKYIYKDQLDRAVTSMFLNIGEAKGRFSKKDKRRFFIFARGSAEECLTIFDLLEDEGIISLKEASKYRGDLIEIVKILTAIIYSKKPVAEH